MISIVEDVPASELKLEVVRGLGLWEELPSAFHHETVSRIQASIRCRIMGVSRCLCTNHSDLMILFPDGSEKHADIAILHDSPQLKNHLTEIVPEAVIEVISADYEAKDYEIGLPFYLAEGVKDVIIYNPADNSVLHCRPDGTRNEMTSPVDIDLVCGCSVTV